MPAIRRLAVNLRRPLHRRPAAWCGVLLIAIAAGLGLRCAWVDGPDLLAQGAGAAGLEDPPPLDPQRVQDQQDMTWADYRPIPGVRWADPALAPARALRVALVAVDFPDQPFVITLPKGSDPFGNPRVDPVPRAEVPRFYADFFGRPGALNHGQTINGYWMEQSRGKVGIPVIDAFGPYRMPKNLFQYGLNEYGQGVGCPAGFACDGHVEPDADALWRAGAGQDVASRYDIVLRIYAGYDETSVWQEFGEMKFASRDDIPAAWGNPDPARPRWVPTRYVPWTSWKAGQMQWGLSSVRQGENSGTITHEIAHFAFETGDNNNNPYVQPYRRVGSGTWDIMDRGSFNGPGGPHNRYVVPATGGAAMPAGFMLRNRVRYGFVGPAQVVQVTRGGLAAGGPVVARVVARAVDPGTDGAAGVIVRLDGAAPRDRTPPCDMKADPLCAGEPVFDFYSIEVVQRIGYDSFTPDNGVLVAKNKDGEGRSCGYNCFTWVIDAHPADARMLDFTRPDGTPVMRTVADYRQLNDALFHAGSGPGSAFEWEDTPNRLHFYVVDRHVDERGVLSYTVGVRSLDSPVSVARAPRLAGPARHALAGAAGRVEFAVEAAGAVAAGAGVGAGTGDIYRLSVSVEGKGWSASLRNELAAPRPGGGAAVPVFLRRAGDGAGEARVTLKAASESDPRRAATLTCVVTGVSAR